MSFIRLGIVFKIDCVMLNVLLILLIGRGVVTSGVGQTYGKGYDLNIPSKWMLKVDRNVLNKIE